jgi:CRP-like cAMP-binding protein
MRIEPILTAQLLEQNEILRGLGGANAQAVIEGGRLVDLKTRQKIYDADATIHEAFFPINSVLSVVTEMQDGGMIEVGTVGCEGVSAIPLLLGSTTSANDSYCQVPGLAISIPVTLFAELAESDPDFRRLLDRYLQSYINLLGQLAACNRLHSVLERCARWLLMTHDRVKHDDLPLTHEYLAMMLGSRRSGVTVAAATLKTAGFIRHAPGHITILDRPGLEHASCECYLVAQKQFAGVFRS